MALSSGIFLLLAQHSLRRRQTVSHSARQNLDIQEIKLAALEGEGDRGEKPAEETRGGEINKRQSRPYCASMTGSRDGGQGHFRLWFVTFTFVNPTFFLFVPPLPHSLPPVDTLLSLQVLCGRLLASFEGGPSLCSSSPLGKQPYRAAFSVFLFTPTAVTLAPSHS